MPRRDLRTTLAPILMRFSRSVVSDQWATLAGKASRCTRPNSACAGIPAEVSHVLLIEPTEARGAALR
ncbi:MAG: hypothetical protein EA376_00545 [Phycisphaeraceae bacterium]|nr:MAG: hypothetical protein EA376_00545 [Phycisphaeraceae bacterium]